jgi:thioredoxin reductase
VIKARRVLVATGLRDELPDIPGVHERWGKDVLHCPLGCDKDDNGRVATDRTGRTGVAGVRAAGNVIGPPAQVVTAAGMGSAAAFAMNSDLLDEDVDRAVEQRRAAAAVTARGDCR